MLDAGGKLPSGLLNINTQWLGDYDLCLDVNGTLSDGFENVDIRGRYCKASINIGIPIPMSLGLCVPSSCQAKDIDAYINDTLSLFERKFGIGIQLDYDVECNPDSIPLDVKTIVCIAVLSVLGLLLVTGTLYDLVHRRRFYNVPPGSNTAKTCIGNKISPVESIDTKSNTHTSEVESNSRAVATNAIMEESPLIPSVTKSVQEHDETLKPEVLGSACMSFSLLNNTRKLFSTKASPKIIQGIDGLRVLSLAWVIFGHTFLYSIPYARNVYTSLPVMTNFSMQPLMNSFYAVDSFFFMSGVLVTYHFLNLLKDKPARLRSIHTWIMFYVHRYIRLTPFYMLVLLVYLSIAKFATSGPFRIEQTPDFEFCKKYWWQNVLYINNFFNIDKNCMGWSWYLANDMQFYIISPLMIIPLFIWPVFGLAIVAALLVTTIIIRGFLSASGGFTLGENGFSYLRRHGHNPDDNSIFYTAPYTRIAPYLIGLLIGYILYKYREPTRLPRIVIILNWALTFTVIVSLIYGSYNEVNGHFNSVAVDAFVNSIDKALWGLALGWIIYATNSGCGGLVGEFLSWRGWTPVARLAYAAYLIHPIIVFLYFKNMKATLYWTTYSTVYIFFGNWVMTYIFSYITSMCFEAPLLGLEKLFLPR